MTFDSAKAQACHAATAYVVANQSGRLQDKSFDAAACLRIAGAAGTCGAQIDDLDRNVGTEAAAVACLVTEDSFLLDASSGGGARGIAGLNKKIDEFEKFIDKFLASGRVDYDKDWSKVVDKPRIRTALLKNLTELAFGLKENCKNTAGVDTSKCTAAQERVKTLIARLDTANEALESDKQLKDDGVKAALDELRTVVGGEGKAQPNYIPLGFRRARLTLGVGGGAATQGYSLFVDHESVDAAYRGEDEPLWASLGGDANKPGGILKWFFGLRTEPLIRDSAFILQLALMYEGFLSGIVGATNDATLKSADDATAYITGHMLTLEIYLGWKYFRFLAGASVGAANFNGNDECVNTGYSIVKEFAPSQCLSGFTMSDLTPDEDVPIISVKAGLELGYHGGGNLRIYYQWMRTMFEDDLKSPHTIGGDIVVDGIKLAVPKETIMKILGWEGHFVIFEAAY